MATTTIRVVQSSVIGAQAQIEPFIGPSLPNCNLKVEMLAMIDEVTLVDRGLFPRR